MSQQIDRKTTKQIRIDAMVHRQLKIKSAKLGKTIKELADETLKNDLSLSLNEEVYQNKND